MSPLPLQRGSGPARLAPAARRATTKWLRWVGTHTPRSTWAQSMRRISRAAMDVGSAAQGSAQPARGGCSATARRASSRADCTDSAEDSGVRDGDKAADASVDSGARAPRHFGRRSNSARRSAGRGGCATRAPSAALRRGDRRRPTGLPDAAHRTAAMSTGSAREREDEVHAIEDRRERLLAGARRHAAWPRQACTAAATGSADCVMRAPMYCEYRELLFLLTQVCGGHCRQHRPMCSGVLVVSWVPMFTPSCCLADSVVSRWLVRYKARRRQNSGSLHTFASALLLPLQATPIRRALIMLNGMSQQVTRPATVSHIAAHSLIMSRHGRRALGALVFSWHLEHIVRFHMGRHAI